ncbi:conjugal transfer protein, partial [Enterococcus faecium]|nr:conjugal transfer protein [Enterococcus faecium]
MREIQWAGRILPNPIGSNILSEPVDTNNRKEEWKMNIKIERSQKEKTPKKKKERVISVGKHRKM